MAAAAENPLLSTGRASDSSLSVQLHPLVLLTISDYVTRHTLRSQEGPVIGAIIGQQNGREVILEHAFQCKTKLGEAVKGEQPVVLDDEWFATRLEQFKDVHKAPALDLVAIFTLGPQSGPLPQHIPVLQQLQHTYNDDLILVLFHPETVLNGQLTGGKLPISLYESYYEPGSEGADEGLQVENWGQGRTLQMRFRELGYEVETGEAEMIGVDFVAKGAGNASAINPAGVKQEAPAESKSSGKGKGKAKDTGTNGGTKDVPLSAEDEELIASLTGKANAIRMLHQRVNLLKAYLKSLPPSYLTDISLTISTLAPDQALNHPLLRHISSLLSRLPLLVPPSSTTTTSATQTTLAKAAANEQSDVHLVSLLSSLTRTIAESREFGNKYSVVQREKNNKKGMSGGGGIGGGAGGGMGGWASLGRGDQDWTPEGGDIGGVFS